jgi:mono/diheme cytochrome c family protein
MNRNIIIIIFSVCGVLMSCTKDKVEASNCGGAEEVSFAATIWPIIEQNCNGCHISGAGGYTFDEYDRIENNASVILDAMRADGGIQLMPIGGPALNDSLINAFEVWMCQGKLNN